MAEIRRRGETYQISVYLGRDENQKKLYERTTYKPEATTSKAIEKEVDDFARDYEKRVRDGEVFSGDKTTFSEFVKIWEENWLPAKTTKVQQSYRGIIKKKFIPVIGHMKLSKIKATHIDAVLNEMKKTGKAPKTVRLSFTAVNSVMQYAFKKDYIKENPCARCDDLPRVERDTELHYFTVEQAKTFLKAMDRTYTSTHKGHKRVLKATGESYEVPEYTESHTIPTQYKAFFRLAIFGGFRRGELCALTWEDINESKRSVSITKSLSKLEKGTQELKGPKTKASNREIVLPAECFEVLKAWKTEQICLCLRLGTAWKGYRGKEFDKNNIFIDMASGSPINVDTPSHKFHEIIDLYNSQIAEREEDKLPHIRLHDLRHTSATLLLANNSDIETVSKRLGHARASVTLDIYGHALKEMDEKASDTLERLFA